MLASDQSTSSSPGQAWIQATTTASVILLAVIAAVVSYGHMHALALRHGEGTWASALIPLSVDGMIVAASMSLLLDSRLGSRGGLPWALLMIGAMASLGANIAVAEPSLTGRVIAAWPSFALTASYELLMREVRQSTVARAALAAEAPGQEMPPLQAAPASAGSAPSSGAAPGPPSAVRNSLTATGRQPVGRMLQRRAWEWALANRGPDGSLPTGTELAREFRRSARWGRLVKTTGLAGQLDIAA